MRWKMAVWSRGGDIDGVIAHSDAGSQYTSIRYTDTLSLEGLVRHFWRVKDAAGVRRTPGRNTRRRR